MSRSLLLVLLIYGLVLAGLITLRGELLVLALPLLLYLGASLVYRPRAVHLSVDRKIDASRVIEGQPVRVTLSITNLGAPLENLQIGEVIPSGLRVIEGETRVVGALGADEGVELAYTVAGPRGLYGFSDVRVSAGDTFDLQTEQVVERSGGRLFVLPQVEKLSRAMIRPRRTRIFAGLVPARRGGPGVEFFGVREYQSGDSRRWINQRVSARFSGEVYVNEFEQERAVDIGLILDARHSANVLGGDRSLFEKSVQATATLADAFLTGGNRVGLFIYGGSVSWTYPGYGKVQRERILQALARARIQQSPVFEGLDLLPARLFPIRSQLVMVSPLKVDDACDLIRLRARGYRVLLVAPDPVDVEVRLLEGCRGVEVAARIARLERAHLHRRLAQAGVQVLEWRAEVPFQVGVGGVLAQLPLWERGPGR